MIGDDDEDYGCPDLTTPTLFTSIKNEMHVMKDIHLTMLFMA